MLIFKQEMLILNQEMLIFKQEMLILNQEDCNVICVDWAAGAVQPNYLRAVANARLVGKEVIWQFLDQVNLICRPGGPAYQGNQP